MADLAEVEKSLAASVASPAASRSSCARCASDHEASANPVVEELQALVGPMPNRRRGGDRRTHCSWKKFRCCGTDNDKSFN